MSRKQGYYLHYSEDMTSGVGKKILNQINELKCYFDIKSIVIHKEKTNIIKSILWRLPFGSYGMDYNQALNEIINPQFLYIRFRPLDIRFILFVKKIKKIYVNTVIVMEIPTYPYGGEYVSDKSMMPWLLKDSIYKHILRKYVDRIVTFSKDDYIHRIPTIRVINGICVDNVQCIKCESEKSDIINIISVSTLRKHHGFERIIKGLSEYCKKDMKYDVVFHIVGDGSEYDYYESLVDKYSLHKNVVMYGNKTGEDLDKIYNIADIAIGSLGFYKIGLERSSTLKVREYLAKGLPIVSGCIEDVFEDNDVDFYMRVSNDDSIVNINAIVKFYIDLITKYKIKTELVKSIREFAYENIDMSVVMRPVISFLEE